MRPVWQKSIHKTKNCSSKCAYDCAQLQYTIQHRTVVIISPLTSRQTSWLRYCLLEEKGIKYMSLHSFNQTIYHQKIIKLTKTIELIYLPTHWPPRSQVSGPEAAFNVSPTVRPPTLPVKHKFNTIYTQLSETIMLHKSP